MLGMDLLRLFDVVAIDFGKREVRFQLSEAIIPFSPAHA